MFQQNASTLTALVRYLYEAFAHSAAHRTGIGFPPDPTALWAEALREAADMALTQDATIAALTIQRNAAIEQIDILSHAIRQLRQQNPAPHRPPMDGVKTGNVVDLSEAFRREQARRRSLENGGTTP